MVSSSEAMTDMNVLILTSCFEPWASLATMDWLMVYPPQRKREPSLPFAYKSIHSLDTSLPHREPPLDTLTTATRCPVAVGLDAEYRTGWRPIERPRMRRVRACCSQGFHSPSHARSVLERTPHVFREASAWFDQAMHRGSGYGIRRRKYTIAAIDCRTPAEEPATARCPSSQRKPLRKS